MIRLRTLGALDLIGADGRVARSVLAQPKRTALLTYLAVTSREGYQRRDSLLGLLWPDLDQQRGRRSLRQSIYVLRRALGADVLVSRGDEEIGADPEHVWCDVTEFRRLLEEGDPAAAVRVYRGDFLAGFFVDSAPAFEQWLDATRAALQREAAEASWQLAHAAAERGDSSGATDWARTAAGHSPGDESGAVRLVEFLERVGDRAAAIRAYEEFSARLSREFGLEPSPGLRELGRRIGSRGPGAEGGDEAIDVEPPPPAAPAATGNGPGLRSGEPVVRPSVPPSRSGRRIRAAILLIGLATVIGLGWVLTRGEPDAERGVRPLDPGVVAVLPFRVRGAEQELAYLANGMVELVSAVLTGEGTLRSVDPGSVLRATRADPHSGEEVTLDAALRIGRDLGAGRVLLGGVAGTPTQLLATARLVDVDSGAVLASAQAAGIEDSLVRVVDQLTGSLLATSAGEPRYRLADLVSRSPVALRSYLSGQAAYRAGRYEEAFRHFQTAVRSDSSFGLAAMQAAEAAGYTAHPDISQRPYQRLAWAARDRMSQRDRAYLVARLGPSFPLPSTGRDLLAAAESAAAAVPDRPEIWYGLGDLLFHFGRALGLEDPDRRSAQAFGRSLEIDSLFAGASLHLLDLRLAQGDTAAARRLVERRLAVDSAGEPIDYMRWRLAHAVSDTTTLAALRRRLDGFRAGDLWRVLAISQETGLDLADADRAAMIALRRATSGPGRAQALEHARVLALNRGRPSEARRLSISRESVGRQEQRNRVLYALYWGADASLVEPAVAALAPGADGPLAADSRLHMDQFSDLCVVGLWRLRAGNLSAAENAAERLRSSASGDRAGYADALRALCAQLLEASVAVERGDAPARTEVKRLADLVRTEPPVFDPLLRSANLVVARLYERLGDPESALAALRRRSFFLNLSAGYLSSYLREEGRLAAVVGDTAGAIRAYRHYLVLRDAPEPGLSAEVAAVRSQLDGLTDGRSR